MPSNSEVINNSFPGLFSSLTEAGDSAYGSGESTGTNAPGNSGQGSPQSAGNNQPADSGASTALHYAELIPGVGTLIGIGADIASIFGGGGTKAAPVFAKYELPASQSFSEAVDASGDVSTADTNQYGLTQSIAQSVAPNSFQPGAPASSAPASAPPAAAPTAAPAGGDTYNTGHTFHQTFNMQAMDGESMAGMSDQIAASVRQSLLTSNALGDVITNDLN